MTKRLLFITNKAETLVTHRLPIALAARAAGYDVHVATPDGREVAIIKAAGLPWHQFHIRRIGRNPFVESVTLFGLFRLYRRVRPDLVHHVTPKLVIYGTLAARAARVPAVVNAISGVGHVFIEKSLTWRLIRSAVQRAYQTALRHPRMRVIFQNPDHRRDFLDAGMVRPADAVMIPGVGVDMSEFHPSEHAPPGDPLVILAARMLWTKGVREFVEAATILRAEGTRARFALVGDPDPGNPASVPESTLRQWHAEGIVEYWGLRRDMPAVLRQASIACLPSYSEGFPKSLLEAAASGLPIVTTDGSGCRVIVRDGENGFLAPVGDVTAIASGLRRLLTDPDLRTRMGKASRRHAQSEFSLPTIVAAHLALYAELTR